MRVFGKLSPLRKKRAFFMIGVFLVSMVGGWSTPAFHW